MTTSSGETNDSQAAEAESRLRAKAKFRTWFCSGAGLALLGQTRAAWFIFLAAWVVLGALAAFFWFPGQATLWLAVAALVAACVLFVVEQRMISRRPVVGPPQGFLVDQFPTATLVFLLALGGLVALALGNIGGVRVAAQGMAPTVEPGEIVAFQKRAPREGLARGVVILHRASPVVLREVPDSFLLSRILADPADELSIEDGRYLVNGDDAGPVASLNDRRVAVVVPAAPQKFTVPEKHYFVVQDNTQRSLDSRVLGLVRADDVVSSRLFWLRPRAFFRRVE